VHTKQQLLNKTQEEILEHWIIYLGYAGIPVTKRTITPKVQALCGRKPSSKWIYNFLSRHPKCRLGRGSKLDDKRARCFNYTTVQKHFERFTNVIKENNIPPENIWNVDEIGCQMGGGRKSTGELSLFATTDTSRYKISSDDLELVTILETVCLDGSASIKPLFVFNGVKHCNKWYNYDPNIQ
jgi:hypothetical protein